MNHNLVDLIDISKCFGDQIVLDKLNLSIRENEFLTLLGPSGCGKTTTLRILGGFENPDSGFFKRRSAAACCDSPGNRQRAPAPASGRAFGSTGPETPPGHAVRTDPSEK